MTLHSQDELRTMDDRIAAAAAEIVRGGIVAFPTETVYGLGANAFNPLAVAKVFDLKARPHFDPLIVHIVSDTDLAFLVERVPEVGRALIDRFWPGPLTLVLPKRPEVPDLVTSGLGSVAVRMPAHPVARRLIEMANVPIAAPSANRFGRISPTTADHVRDEFGDELPWILDAGACVVGVESTVVSLMDEQRPILLRPGGISLEELQDVSDSIELVGDDRSHASLQPASAPGMLASHYAPRTPLWLVDDERAARLLLERLKIHHWGWLGLQPPANLDGVFWTDPAASEILSATSDLREAAANLFAAMRRLDHLQLEAIIATRVPNQGVGRAINDRLRRAAARDA